MNNPNPHIFRHSVPAPVGDRPEVVAAIVLGPPTVFVGLLALMCSSLPLLLLAAPTGLVWLDVYLWKRCQKRNRRRRALHLHGHLADRLVPAALLVLALLCLVAGGIWLCVR